MSFVIVPNHVHDLISRRLDEAIKSVPEAQSDREAFYGALLNYYNEHGELPEDIRIERKPLPE